MGWSLTVLSDAWRLSQHQVWFFVLVLTVFTASANYIVSRVLAGLRSSSLIAHVRQFNDRGVIRTDYSLREIVSFAQVVLVEGRVYVYNYNY